MLTADQRKELETLEADVRYAARHAETTSGNLSWKYPAAWSDRIAAVLANGQNAE